VPEGGGCQLHEKVSRISEVLEAPAYRQTYEPSAAGVDGESPISGRIHSPFTQAGDGFRLTVLDERSVRLEDRRRTRQASFAVIHGNHDLNTGFGAEVEDAGDRRDLAYLLDA